MRLASIIRRAAASTTMEMPTHRVCNFTAPLVGITAPMPTRGQLIGAGSSTTNYYHVQVDDNNTYKFQLMDSQQRAQHSANKNESVKTNHSSSIHLERKLVNSAFFGFVNTTTVKKMPKKV